MTVMITGAKAILAASVLCLPAGHVLAQDQVQQTEQRLREVEASQRIAEIENRQAAVEQQIRSSQVQADLDAQAARGREIHRSIDNLNAVLAAGPRVSPPAPRTQTAGADANTMDAATAASDKRRKAQARLLNQ